MASGETPGATEEAETLPLSTWFGGTSVSGYCSASLSSYFFYNSSMTSPTLIVLLIATVDCQG